MDEVIKDVLFKYPNKPFQLGVMVMDWVLY
jgi:hypothetical protein